MNDEANENVASAAEPKHSREELYRMWREVGAALQNGGVHAPYLDDELLGIVFNNIRNLLLATALFVTGNTFLSSTLPHTFWGRFDGVLAFSLVGAGSVLYWLNVNHAVVKLGTYGMLHDWRLLRRTWGKFILSGIICLLSLAAYQITYDTKLPLVHNDTTSSATCVAPKATAGADPNAQ